MKKYIFFSILAVVVLSSSCRKMYECTCTMSSTSASGTSTSTATESSSHRMTKRQATDWCETYEENYTTAYTVYSNSCTLE